MDQRLLAAPHGFSQRATSFIASWCQGIHRTPFSCSQLREHKAEAPCSHLAQEPSNPLRRVQDLSPSTGSHRTSSISSLLCRPIPHSCENNRVAETDAPSSTSILFTLLNTLRLRGLGSLSRSSSGQTCNRRVQTRQTLIHMSKEQKTSPPRKTSPHPRDHCPATSYGGSAQCSHDLLSHRDGVSPYGGGRYRTDDPLLAKQVLSH